MNRRVLAKKHSKKNLDLPNLSYDITLLSPWDPTHSQFIFLHHNSLNSHSDSSSPKYPKLPTKCAAAPVTTQTWNIWCELPQISNYSRFDRPGILVVKKATPIPYAAPSRSQNGIPDRSHISLQPYRRSPCPVGVQRHFRPWSFGCRTRKAAMVLRGVIMVQ